jgi:hypothetical protein
MNVIERKHGISKNVFINNVLICFQLSRQLSKLVEYSCLSHFTVHVTSHHLFHRM